MTRDGGQRPGVTSEKTQLMRDESVLSPADTGELSHFDTKQIPHL